MELNKNVLMAGSAVAVAGAGIMAGAIISKRAKKNNSIIGVDNLRVAYDSAEEMFNKSEAELNELRATIEIEMETLGPAALEMDVLEELMRMIEVNQYRKRAYENAKNELIDKYLILQRENKKFRNECRKLDKKETELIEMFINGDIYSR